MFFLNYKKKINIFLSKLTFLFLILIEFIAAMSQKLKNSINLACSHKEKLINNQINKLNNLIFQPYRINYNLLLSLNESSNDYSSKSNEKLDLANKAFLQLYDFKRKTKKTDDSDEDYEAIEFSLINSLNRAKSVNEALKALNLMWREVKFCDLIIVCNGLEHLAHKAVLAFYSSKYR